MNQQHKNPSQLELDIAKERLKSAPNIRAQALFSFEKKYVEVDETEDVNTGDQSLSADAGLVRSLLIGRRKEKIRNRDAVALRDNSRNALVTALDLDQFMAKVRITSQAVLKYTTAPKPTIDATKRLIQFYYHRYCDMCPPFPYT